MNPVELRERIVFRTFINTHSSVIITKGYHICIQMEGNDDNVWTDIFQNGGEL